MNTIRTLCNRCIVLEHGQKVYDGDVEGAIRVYSDRNLTVQKQNILETAHVDVLHYVEFERLTFLNSDTCEYTRSDSMEFEVCFKSYVHLEHVHLRFLCKFLNDEACGVFFSQQFALEKNRDYALRIRLPLIHFPNGEFFIRLVFCMTNSFGTQFVFARCLKAACFIVKDDKNSYFNMEWPASGWGAYLGNVTMEIV